MRDSYFDLPSRIEDAFAEIDSDIVMDLLNTDCLLYTSDAADE